MSLRKDLDAVIDLPVPTREKLVLAVLLRHRNGTTGRCDPGIELLAKKTGCCAAMVYEALRELELAGYVKPVVKGGGRGQKTNYVLNLPGCAPAGIAPNPPRHELFQEENPPVNGLVNGLPEAVPKTNKVLNAFNTVEHGFPPQRAQNGNGGLNGKSRLDQALANIAAVRAKRRGMGR